MPQIGKNINSRQLARKWPFLRYEKFEETLRKAASEWFKEKSFKTHPRNSYCLANWDDWEKNIILDEVAGYIRKVKNDCEQKRKPFPLHKYIHHALSSQAMAFNLIGPLITRKDYEPIVSVLQTKGLPNSNDIFSASFEYEDRDIFNEDSGQPTSIDIVLKNNNGRPIIFIESKLVERGFGGCSVFAGGDCNGQNPINNYDYCFLHFIGRKYWVLMDKHGFSEILRNEKLCIFVEYYQFFRELLFSIEKGGVFVLLSDERSPVFHCKVNGIERGKMAFLTNILPKQHKDRIMSISIQEMVEAIRRTNRHTDWINEFEKKYGLHNRSLQRTAYRHP
ncbi:MAG TPA: hypothetical protein P5239_02480 [Victivallales bacterium]|nr:hypothetical protein [Victivallales bacterium]HRU00549.1 hypothetical protein [Victivallales bacterium]